MLLSIGHRVLLAVERDLSLLRRFLWCLVFKVFSLYTTPQRWPISGIRMVHRLPPRFSDSIGSRVPFTMESPLGSS